MAVISGLVVGSVLILWLFNTDSGEEFIEFLIDVLE